MIEKTSNNFLPHSITVVVVVLMAIGTIFVCSAGATLSGDFTLENFYKFSNLRQILFFPIAVLVLYCLSAFGYQKFGIKETPAKSLSPYLLIVSVILLALVLTPLGVEINNARRWLFIPAGPIKISFQPSELAKWSVVIFLAAACDKYGQDLKKSFKTWLAIGIPLAVVIGLIVLEDLGTAALIVIVSAIMLLLGGARLWHLLLPLPLGVAGFGFVLLNSPARLSRITAFMNPDKYTDTINYQPTQSLIALGSGQIWGKGLGGGISKYGHLPEDTTDFIFAIIGEELGVVGTLAIILLFIILMVLVFIMILRCQDSFAKLLATGIILTISIQAILNIGVVTVVLPTKGIPLPFVSAGGTSMLLSAAVAGILINIARQNAKIGALESR